MLDRAGAVPQFGACGGNTFYALTNNDDENAGCDHCKCHRNNAAGAKNLDHLFHPARWGPEIEGKFTETL